MEISLSFDNAVLNATVLRSMSPLWQRRFLTWGILTAVVGMRLIFPIIIVTIATGLSLAEVVNIAINDPAKYSAQLQNSHISISTFGGVFLLMIFLKFIFDASKEVHWFHFIEKKLSELGKMESIEISIIVCLILILQHFIPIEDRNVFLVAGISGVLTYVFINSLMEFCGVEHSAIPKQGIMAFIYLEIVDASCSLDGVIGAFVLTNNIILIMIGLGIGAFCIRALTVYLVRGGVLQEYIYLEHGAHYGIGALAIIMLTSIFYQVPEPVTGLLGMSFIGLSLLSSIKHRRKI